jgi:hypothetical protein
MPAVIHPTSIDIARVTKQEALGYGELVKKLGEEYTVHKEDKELGDEPSVTYRWRGNSGVYVLALHLTFNFRSSGVSAGLSVSIERSDPARRPGYAGSYVPFSKRKKLRKGEYFHLFSTLNKNFFGGGFGRVAFSIPAKIAKLCGRFLPLFANAYFNIYDCIGQDWRGHEELHGDPGEDEFDESRIADWLRVGNILTEHYAARKEKRSV